MRRKKLYIPLIVLLLVCLMLTGAAMYTQTQAFKNRLRNQVISTLDKTINGKIVIDKIDGNLVSNFHITGIKVITPADTILSIAVLTLQFAPLELLYKRLSFHTIRIESPVINLVQYTDKTWNYNTLIKKQGYENRQQDTKKNKSSLNLLFNKIKINDGSFKITTVQDSQRLLKAEHINVNAGLWIKNSSVSAKLEKLNFNNVKPPLSLKQAQFTMTIADSLLQIQDLVLQTDSSLFNGNGTFNLRSTNIEQVQFKAVPLQLGELVKFFPGLPMSGECRVDAEAKTQKDTLKFQLTTVKGNGTIAVNGALGSLDAQPCFDLHITTNDIDLEEWLEKLSIPVSFSGKLHIQGSGKDLEHLQTTVNAELPECSVNQISLINLNIQAMLDNKIIKTNLRAKHGNGVITTNSIIKLKNSFPYTLAANIQRLDLEKLVPQLSTNINGALQAQGNLKNLQQSSLVNGQFSKSSLANYTLDTLFTTLQYQNKQIKLDTLYLHSKQGELCMNGAGAVDSLSIINFIYNVTSKDTLLPHQNLFTDGNIAGSVSGSIDSFFVAARVDLANLSYNSNSAKTVKGSGKLYFANKEFHGSSSISLYNNILAGLKADSLYIKSNFYNNNLTNAISFAINDTISGYINNHLHFNDTSTLLINEIDLNLGAMHWYGEHYPMIFSVDENGYKIQNFNIHSEEQNIKIKGAISQHSNEQLDINIRNLQLAKLGNIIKTGLPISGILNSDLKLTGSLQEPEFNGDLQCTALKYNSIKLDNVKAIVHYKNNSLQFSSTLQRNDTESIVLNGVMPVNITPGKEQPFLSREEPVKLTIYSESVDISFLDLLSNNITRTTGKTSIDITVSETIAHPNINGSFTIKNGSLAIARYGSYFNNIQMQLALNNNKITINQLTAENEKGQLQISGFIGLSNKLDKWEESSLVIKTSNFPIAKSQNVELIVNSNILLNGNPEKPVFDGTIDVLRAKLFIPAFLSLQKQVAEQSTSILKDNGKQQSETSANQATLLNKSRGKIKVNMTRNAWLRNNEMNVELSGALDMIKETPQIKLFGDIQTVRGTIDLYGKQFKIKEGKLAFTGSEELSPEITIQALHEFRDVYSEKKNLLLIITGKLDQPVIAFQLDDAQIEEKDAVSYLLFGQKSDELSFGEKSQLVQNQGMVSASGVEQMFTSRLSGEISTKLQKRLNLDMVEFKGMSNRGQASLVLGKYITNDLFLSYQRDFNLGRSHEIATDEISLEYEINKYLFLQATKGDDKTTGFDLFWKFEK